MNCQRCSTLPVTDIRHAVVYMKLPTLHHLEPIKAMLNHHAFSHREAEGGIFVQVNDFQGFITALDQQGYYRLEQEDMMILPLQEGAELTFSALNGYKSLKQWKDLYEGKVLLEILQQKRLKILFHPIIDTSTGSIYGYEALSRGIDEEGKLVSPVHLFQMAKKMDLLFYLDRLCRETIIQRASECGIRKKLFLNFVPTSIYDPEKCLQSTDTAINKYGLDPGQIVFEVVETERVEDFEHLNYILDYYRNKGYATALDDMGSGYSSISTLLALNPNYMKIDMGLIRNIHQEPEKQMILKEYINVARMKGIRVLAEGIENREEQRYLQAQQLDLMQGYYFAKPSEIPLLDLKG